MDHVFLVVHKVTFSKSCFFLVNRTLIIVFGKITAAMVLNMTNELLLLLVLVVVGMTNEHISASFTLHKSNASPVKCRIVGLHCCSCKVNIIVLICMSKFIVT